MKNIKKDWRFKLEKSYHYIKRLYDYLESNNYPYDDYDEEYDEKTFNVTIKGLNLTVSRSNNMDIVTDDLTSSNTFDYYIEHNDKIYNHKLSNIPSFLKYLKLKDSSK